MVEEKLARQSAGAGDRRCGVAGAGGDGVKLLASRVIGRRAGSSRHAVSIVASDGLSDAIGRRGLLRNTTRDIHARRYQVRLHPPVETGAATAEIRHVVGIVAEEPEVFGGCRP